MAKVTVDNSGERFGDKTTIADLAANTPFLLALESDDLNIYLVQMLMQFEWRHEIESFEYEILHGYSAKFKDGSAIYIGAWKDGDDSFWYSARGAERAKEIFDSFN